MKTRKGILVHLPKGEMPGALKPLSLFYAKCQSPSIMSQNLFGKPNAQNSRLAHLLAT